jgi:D-alanyl-D-alanine carboxypeptidase
MDGITAITQRMAAIQATVASLAPPAPVPSRAAAAASSATFGAALDKAVSETAQAKAPAPVFVDGVPADLAAYGNGRIPKEALDQVGSTQHRLWAPAAGAFEDLLDAAARDGVEIGITDSYRSYDAQVDVAKRKGLYSQGGLAAKPGTSEHGWGLSLDLDLGSKALTWMRQHAKEYGFSENVPREPWHWTFKPNG